MKHGALWLAGQRSPGFASLDGHFEADVAVVGAGITGLTAALLLKRAGLRVAVLERRGVASGSTGSSTGHLTALLDAGYHELERTFDLATARGVAWSMMSAIRTVEELVTSLGIDCAFRRVSAYYYSEDEAGAEEVHAEREAAVRAGLEAMLDDRPPLPFRVSAGLRLDGQARFDPVGYCLGLARAIQGDGCLICEGTEVREVHDGTPCTLITTGGEVRARDVLLATHTPVGVSLLHTLLEPVRSHALAARLTEPPPDGLFWDTAEPYHYIRLHPLEGVTVLVVGGADHHTGKGDGREAQRELEQYTCAHFPVASIEHSWSSQYYLPGDGLPIIGHNPGSDHVWVATGFLGDGLTFGTVAGTMLAGLLTRGEHPQATLFSPGRLNLARARQLVELGLEVGRELVGGRLRGAFAEAERLAPGEGRLLREGVHQVAASRTLEGELQLLAPVCTHLGCTVAWNAAERSWDCACHGSRFDQAGRPIEGPATRALRSLERPES